MICYLYAENKNRTLFCSLEDMEGRTVYYRLFTGHYISGKYTFDVYVDEYWVNHGSQII